MASNNDSLYYHPRWWWDPIDMEVFKELEQERQHELLATSLETQAQILQTHSEGLQKMSAALRQNAGAQKS